MILPEILIQDLRYAARMIYRNIGFTAVAVFALAIGIGVNTAVFTAYKAMVARSLDARNPGEMVNLALIRNSGATDFSFSYPDYQAYRDSAHSFRGLIAFSPEHMRLSDASGIVSPRSSAAGSAIGSLGLLPSGTRNAEFAFVFVVSENYFRVLGVPALRGRAFESAGVPGLVASPSVLIRENYWRKRFASNPAVLGKTIRLNGAALTIIGITPHDFVGTSVAAPDFWLPVSLEPLVHANGNWLRDRENKCCRLFGRLASGVSIAQARAEMTILADHLRALHDPHSTRLNPPLYSFGQAPHSLSPCRRIPDCDWPFCSSWPPPVWCCSSLAPTSPVCNWPVPDPARLNCTHDCLWEPPGDALSGNC